MKSEPCLFITQEKDVIKESLSIRLAAINKLTDQNLLAMVAMQTDPRPLYTGEKRIYYDLDGLDLLDDFDIKNSIMHNAAVKKVTNQSLLTIIALEGEIKVYAILPLKCLLTSPY